jgi:hypothetical protein
MGCAMAMASTSGRMENVMRVNSLIQSVMEREFFTSKFIFYCYRVFIVKTEIDLKGYGMIMLKTEWAFMYTQPLGRKRFWFMSRENLSSNSEHPFDYK